MIESFNNKTDKVGDDLKINITKGSSIDVAAGIFSIYGFSSLKKQFSKIDRLRFIFTDPTFIELEKEKKNNGNLRLIQITVSDLLVALILKLA